MAWAWSGRLGSCSAGSWVRWGSCCRSRAGRRAAGMQARGRCPTRVIQARAAWCPKRGIQARAACSPMRASRRPGRARRRAARRPCRSPCSSATSRQVRPGGSAHPRSSTSTATARTRSSRLSTAPGSSTRRARRSARGLRRTTGCTPPVSWPTSITTARPRSSSAGTTARWPPTSFEPARCRSSRAGPRARAARASVPRRAGWLLPTSTATAQSRSS